MLSLTDVIAGRRRGVGFPGRQTDRWAAAWRAAWARQAAGGGQAVVSVFGDSISQGYFATAPYYQNSYAGVIGSELQTFTGITPGSGWVPVYEFNAVADPRMAEVGVWSDMGSGGFFDESRKTTTGSFTFGPITCSAFRVMYLTAPGGGSWTAQVDSGSTTAYTSAGASGSHIIDIDAGGLGSHTLTLASTGTAMYVVAVEAVRNPLEGVKVNRIAYSTKVLLNLLYDSPAGYSTFDCFELVETDLAIFAFGMNDGNGHPFSYYESWYQVAVDYCQTNGISMLMVEPPPPNPATIADWQTYTADAQAFAASNGIGFINFEDIFGPYGTIPSYYNDNIHPSNAGHTAMGEYIAGYLTDLVGAEPAAFAATGGTITDAGGYRYHTFTAGGTFEITNGTADVDYLVVAGGGGGASGNSSEPGGGGGAGGMKTGTLTALGLGSYAVTVGAGGAGGAYSGGGVTGTAGSASSLGALVSCSGGGGGRGGAAAASNGGSGGGGAGVASFTTAGTGTGGEGNNGGAGVGSPNWAGGGGGGASAAGSAGAALNGGNGGAGSQWPAASGTYYAGGGGGGGWTASVQSSGGQGGGGAGRVLSGAASVAGTANTGGGGGGGAGLFPGSAGGSGIVIVRYLI